MKLSTVLKKNPIYRKKETILSERLSFVNSRYHKDFIGNTFSISPAGNRFTCDREYSRVFRKGWAWLWKLDGQIIFGANIPGGLEHVRIEAVLHECRSLLLGLLYNCPPEFPCVEAQEKWELVRIDCCLFWGIPFTSFIKKEKFEECWKYHFGEDASAPEINDRWWNDKGEWLF